MGREKRDVWQGEVRERWDGERFGIVRGERWDGEVWVGRESCKGGLGWVGGIVGWVGGWKGRKEVMPSCQLR